MEQWIAEAIGKMHIYGISQSNLAKQMGVRREYLNRVLNGKEHPANAEKRVLEAIEIIIKGQS